MNESRIVYIHIATTLGMCKVGSLEIITNMLGCTKKKVGYYLIVYIVQPEVKTLQVREGTLRLIYTFRRRFCSLSNVLNRKEAMKGNVCLQIIVTGQQLENAVSISRTISNSLTKE